MRFKAVILLVCLVITILLLWLFWLAFVILISIAFYFFFNLIVFKHLIKNKWVQGLFKVTGLFILSILIRVFCIDIYTVSGESMENTLYSGDIVLINKLIHGPSIPASPYGIPWINVVWLSIHKRSIDYDTLHWDAYRLKGISKINRGDIVVSTTQSFSMHNILFIKRCVAISGDTIAIENGTVKINGNLQSDPNLSKNPYYIKIKNITKFNQMMDSLGIKTRKKIITKHELYMDLTYQEKTSIENKVDSLSIKTVNKDDWIYPNDSVFQWTIDNYGPVIIPKKGMTIHLDNYTYPVYAKTIKESEQRVIEKKNGFFYIKDSIITEYTFQNDYYFLMGDNRHNSVDCRNWGIFIPSKYIIGKTNTVLFSNNKFKNRNERLFKRLL
jgi:signal peptidase I